jgi:molybdenum cofactor cytidylyltransferase
VTRVFGIVLASGQSIRMGKPKLLLHWQGVSLLEHILNKTKSIPFEQVQVVIPDQNEYLKNIVTQYKYSHIYNKSPHMGLGNSLSLAIGSLPLSTEAAIILLGDQPTLSAEEIRKVWFSFTQLRSRHEYCPKVIIQMKYRDGKVGHPILFSHHFFEELKSLSGDKGGRDIILTNAHWLTLCQSGKKYPHDIDTPYDYQQLLKGEGEG